MNMSKSRDIQAKMPSPKVIYASNESKSVLARNLDECRDNDKNSQSVFLSFKCIFARNCEVTEQLQFMNKMYAITIYSHGFFISASGEYAVLQRSGEERNSPVVPESTVLPYVPPQRNGCNLQNGHTAVPVRRRWLSAVRSVHKV